MAKKYTIQFNMDEGNIRSTLSELERVFSSFNRAIANIEIPTDKVKELANALSNSINDAMRSGASALSSGDFSGFTKDLGSTADRLKEAIDVVSKSRMKSAPDLKKNLESVLDSVNAINTGMTNLSSSAAQAGGQTERAFNVPAKSLSELRAELEKAQKAAEYYTGVLGKIGEAHNKIGNGNKFLFSQGSLKDSIEDYKRTLAEIEKITSDKNFDPNKRNGGIAKQIAALFNKSSSIDKLFSSTNNNSDFAKAWEISEEQVSSFKSRINELADYLKSAVSVFEKQRDNAIQSISSIQSAIDESPENADSLLNAKKQRTVKIVLKLDAKNVEEEFNAQLERLRSATKDNPVIIQAKFDSDSIQGKINSKSGKEEVVLKVGYDQAEAKSKLTSIINDFNRSIKTSVVKIPIEFDSEISIEQLNQKVKDLETAVSNIKITSNADKGNKKTTDLGVKLKFSESEVKNQAKDIAQKIQEVMNGYSVNVVVSEGKALNSINQLVAKAEKQGGIKPITISVSTELKRGGADALSQFNEVLASMRKNAIVPIDVVVKKVSAEGLTSVLANGAIPPIPIDVNTDGLATKVVNTIQQINQIIESAQITPIEIKMSTPSKAELTQKITAKVDDSAITEEVKKIQGIAKTKPIVMHVGTAAAVEAVNDLIGVINDASAKVKPIVIQIDSTQATKSFNDLIGVINAVALAKTKPVVVGVDSTKATSDINGFIDKINTFAQNSSKPIDIRANIPDDLKQLIKGKATNAIDINISGVSGVTYAKDQTVKLNTASKNVIQSVNGMATAFARSQGVITQAIGKEVSGMQKLLSALDEAKNSIASFKGNSFTNSVESAMKSLSSLLGQLQEVGVKPIKTPRIDEGMEERLKQIKQSVKDLENGAISQGTVDHIETVIQAVDKMEQSYRSGTMSLKDYKAAVDEFVKSISKVITDENKANDKLAADKFKAYSKQEREYLSVLRDIEKAKYSGKDNSGGLASLSSYAAELRENLIEARKELLKLKLTEGQLDAVGMLEQNEKDIADAAHGRASLRWGNLTNLKQSENMRGTIEGAELARDLSKIDIKRVFDSAAITQFAVSGKNARGEIESYIYTLDKATGEIYKLDTATRQAASGTQSLGNFFSNAANYMMRYLGMYMSAYRIIGEIRNGFQYVKELDTALTEFQVVTKEADDTISKFADDAYKVADSVASTTAEVVKSSTEWARLGYNMEDSLVLAAQSAKLAKTGFMEVSESTEQLTASIQAFYGADLKKGIITAGEAATHVSDELVALGNQMPITSQGLGAALERSAGSLVAAGNSIEESVALLATANATIQNPESIGTGFKTVAARLRGKHEVPPYEVIRMLCA